MVAEARVAVTIRSCVGSVRAQRQSKSLWSSSSDASRGGRYGIMLFNDPGTKTPALVAIPQASARGTHSADRDELLCLPRLGGK